MRRDYSPTDASKNFERRLRQTTDSELEPEMYTPNSAAFEENPEKGEVVPLVKQFNTTNMRGRGGRNGNPSGRGRDVED